MSHASQIINFEPPQPAETGTVGSQTAYNPGLSYLVGPALYELMKIWSEISILYQKLVTTTTQSETKAANSAASFEVEQGVEMKNQAFAQGISSMVGGGLTLGTAAAGSFGKDAELENLKAEQKGIVEYQTTLKKATSEDGIKEGEGENSSDEYIESRFEELMDQKSFKDENPHARRKDESGRSIPSDEAIMQSMSDNSQKAQLREKYTNKLREVEKAIQDRMTIISNNTTKRTTAAQALGQITSGAGQTASGEYALEQKKAESKETVTKNAQTILQGIDSHFRSQVEKMVEAALQIISTLASISHANKANS